MTIYLTGNAEFHVGGGVEVNLASPSTDAPPAIKGMLIYAAAGNTGSVELNGNSNSHYTGTVYVPDGTSNTLRTISTQLIGSRV